MGRVKSLNLSNGYFIYLYYLSFIFQCGGESRQEPDVSVKPGGLLWAEPATTSRGDCGGHLEHQVLQYSRGDDD